MTEHADAEVTAAQIARLAGVGRAAVSNWRKRHADFPAPVGGSDTSPTFSLQAVEDWLRTEGKLDAIPAAEQLWRSVDASPGDEGAAALALVDVARVLLVGEGRKQGWWWAADDIAHLEALTAEEGGAAAAFEVLVGRFLDAYARDRDTGGATPALGDLMVRLALPGHRMPATTPAAIPAQRLDSGDGETGEPGFAEHAFAGGPADGEPAKEPPVVLDPNTGAGALLLAAAGLLPGATLRGSTREAPLGPIAAARIAVAARDLAEADRPAVDIGVGDCLRSQARTPADADAVVSQPPFAQRDWGFDELAYDPRFEYGMPPRGEPELAWVEHALSRLRPLGLAAMVLPPAVASRRSGRRIRAELLRRGVVRAVIALPPGSSTPPGIALHLWLMQKPDQPPRPLPPTVLFVDASDAPRGEQTPTPETASAILEAWLGFHRDPGSFVPEAGFSAAPPVITLLDDAVDLSPGRHVPRPDTGLGRDHLDGARSTVEAVLARLASLLPAVGQGSDPAAAGGAYPAGAPPWPLTTLGDLARTGALTLLPAEAVPAPGDVLVPVLGGAAGQARVLTEQDGAVARPSPRGTAVLRTDPAHLDAWFVAGFLRSDAAARRALSHASTSGRMDIRKAPLPRLPLDRQRKYAAAFRNLAEFSDTLRVAAELGERLAQGLTDALAEGVVEP